MFNLDKEIKRSGIIEDLRPYYQEIDVAEKYVRRAIKNETTLIHTLGVRDFAFEIVTSEGGNSFVIFMAAMFHDIAKDVVVFKEHAEAAAESFRNFYESDEIMNIFHLDSLPMYQDKIIHCIQAHVSLWSLSGQKPETLEAKIIADADMVQQLGPFGIVKHMEKHSALPFFERLDATTDDLEQAFGVLQTETGKKIGRKRMEFVRAFIADARSGM